jgi:hypothetical protein
METVWKDKKQISPPSTPLGTFIGALLRNIDSKGREHQAKLIEDGHPNQFVSVPKIPNFIWDAIMTRHPKSLAACMLLDGEDKAEIFDTTMQEIFRLGADTVPLHLKLGLWHAELKRTKSKPVLKREEVKVVVMPRQQWL